MANRTRVYRAEVKATQILRNRFFRAEVKIKTLVGDYSWTGSSWGAASDLVWDGSTWR